MKDKKPKISVIVPVYNVENYLKRCLDSLINQTFNDFEIIAVNDGSKDTSLEVLISYAEQDRRITVINKENSGVSDSRNIGISHANGDYIVFVDSDDWVLENMLEVMYRQAILSNCDLVMCTYVREFGNHSKVKEFDLPMLVVYEKKEIASYLHRRLFGPLDDELKNPEGLDALGTVWAKLYRSDIIKNYNIKFIDLSIIGSNEDSLFNIHYFYYIKKAIFLNKSFYHYWKVNNNSITSKYNPILREQWFNLFDYMHRFITENRLGSSYYKALENRICMSVLGLGLNECSKENKQPTREKIKNIRGILNDDMIKNAYSTFNLGSFSLHWRLFYFFNKRRMETFSYFMLRTIELLRTRV